MVYNVCEGILHLACVFDIFQPLLEIDSGLFQSLDFRLGSSNEWFESSFWVRSCEFFREIKIDLNYTELFEFTQPSVHIYSVYIQCFCNFLCAAGFVLQKMKVKLGLIHCKAERC